MASYPSWLPFLLGLLTAVGPLSTDMYLPSFPALEASLGGQPGTAQVTLATWFVGLALGQLTQGPLADRYGRRLPLALGMACYTVANAGCAVAPDLWSFAALRFIAAFGGSAGVVIPRAIVRDLADGHEAARLMSRLMLVMGVAPIVAPTLGGLVLGFANWHAIFWITSAYGAICVLATWWALPDTLPPARRTTLGIAVTAGRYAGVLRDKVFLAYMLMSAFGMFGMFAYIAGSSPVMIQHFALTPTQYGMVFACSAGAFIVASQVNPVLVHRVGAARVLRAASLVYGAAAACMLAFALAGWGGAGAIVGSMMVTMGGIGFIMPNAAVGALSHHAAHAGSASALIGTAGFGFGAVSGLLVGVLSRGGPATMAALVVVGALGAIAADRLRPAPA